MSWRREDEHEDESFGQVDGDSSGPVQFVSNLGSVGIPWLREGIPPWHLWGNTIGLRTLVQESALGVPIQPSAGQLVKIAYKRPETWQWLFSAKLISGPLGSLTAPGVTLTLYFDLVTGIGRSSILMQHIGGAGVTGAVSSRSRSFEQYEFNWDSASGGFPVGAQIWTTQVLAPARRFQTYAPDANYTGNAVPPGESSSVINRIVAQDLQLSCRLFASAFTGDTAIGQAVELEVSAQFAPVVHVRPEWFDDGVAEQRYAGAETGGK